MIENMMCQALEAFSTFEYRMDIETVSTDQQILSLLPTQEYLKNTVVYNEFYLRNTCISSIESTTPVTTPFA